MWLSVKPRVTRLISETTLSCVERTPHVTKSLAAAQSRPALITVCIASRLMFMCHQSVIFVWLINFWIVHAWLVLIGIKLRLRRHRLRQSAPECITDSPWYKHCYFPVAAFVSNIAIFVLKRDVKLQLTNSSCCLTGLVFQSCSSDSVLCQAS